MDEDGLNLPSQPAAMPLLSLRHRFPLISGLETRRISMFRGETFVPLNKSQYSAVNHH
jgi:hypothetical protein